MPATFIIIGAMKAGTTTVRAHLRTHPEVSMARASETHFFVREHNWTRGLDWYRSQFDLARPIRGDVSPNYSKRRTFPGVPQRIRDTLPDARLIYLLRDPLARLVSHYRHNVARGRERRSFDQAMADLEGNGYVEASLYHHQLEAFLDCFSWDAIRTITLEDLARDPAGTMREIYRFIGADPAHEAPGLGRVFHSGAAKRRPRAWTQGLTRSAPGRGIRRLLGSLVEARVVTPVIPPELHARLLERLRPDVEALRDLTGRAYEDWSLGTQA